MRACDLCLLLTDFSYHAVSNRSAPEDSGDLDSRLDSYISPVVIFEKIG